MNRANFPYNEVLTLSDLQLKVFITRFICSKYKNNKNVNDILIAYLNDKPYPRKRDYGVNAIVRPYVIRREFDVLYKRCLEFKANPLKGGIANRGFGLHYIQLKNKPISEVKMEIVKFFLDKFKNHEVIAKAVVTHRFSNSTKEAEFINSKYKNNIIYRSLKERFRLIVRRLEKQLDIILAMR